MGDVPKAVGVIMLAPPGHYATPELFDAVNTIMQAQAKCQDQTNTLLEECERLEATAGSHIPISEVRGIMGRPL
jgi:hypothetical protein